MFNLINLFMREPITKEHLNEGFYLKVDIPIWEEFTIGLIEQGGWATNDNFSGVRSIQCKVPNSSALKDVFIVSDNEKSKKFFEFIKEGFIDRNKEMYDRVDITQCRRGNKNVYVIEYEYAKTN